MADRNGRGRLETPLETPSVRTVRLVTPAVLSTFILSSRLYNVSHHKCHEFRITAPPRGCVSRFKSANILRVHTLAHGTAMSGQKDGRLATPKSAPLSGSWNGNDKEIKNSPWPTFEWDGEYLTSGQVVQECLQVTYSKGLLEVTMEHQAHGINHRGRGNCEAV